MATPVILAMKDGDRVARPFPTGLQVAIDYLGGGKGKVFIGPGTYEHTTCISVHSNVHIQGAGAGVTIIKRATGSLLTGDATNSGSSFIATPFGSNGTIATQSTGQADITIADLTIDGNQSNFGSVNPATPTHMGIRMPYTDGLRIMNLEVVEFLQSGIHLDEAREVFIDSIKLYKLGQYGSASARNGITLVNNNSFLAGYSRSVVIQNCISDTVTDAHFYCGGYTDVTYSGIQILGGGQFGFEMETTSSATNTQRVTIVNSTAAGLTKEFMRMGQLSGSATTFQDILLRNCSCTFAASTHSGFAVRAANSTNVIVKRFKMSGCTFLNCNSSDAANVPYFFFETTNTTPSQDISIEDCTFNGALPSSTVTSSHGMDIRGSITNLVVQNVAIRDAQGKGIYVHTKTASCTIQNARLTNCSVYNCTDDGISVITDAATGTIKRIKLDGCYVEDACEATGTNAFRVGPVQGTTTGQDIRVVNCNSVKVSSTLLTRGIRIEAGASSTSDSYIIATNDFSGFTVAGDLEYANTGTSTNVQFSDPVARGADVASAATVTLKLGSLFHITGTTAITTLNPCITWDRRPITFIMDSTASFTDGGNMKLAGNGPNTADDTITMAYDGANWFEIARAVN